AVLDYQRSRLSARVRLIGHGAVNVIRRGAAVEPLAELRQTRGQAPFGQHLQRHRARRAGLAAGGETALEEPTLERGGLRIGGDGVLEQRALDTEPDRVGRRVALAPAAPPLRRLERGE